VLAGLHVQFSPEERDRMQADIPANPLAYDYYLRSVAYPLSLEGDRLAVEMAKKSVQLDSTYSPAFSELGFRTHQIAEYEVGSTDKLQRAEEAYLKALSLDENQLRALGSLPTIYTETGRTEEAVDLLRRALKINPNNAGAHFGLSYVYRYGGMLRESLSEGEAAIGLDPKNRRFRSIAVTYVYLGEHERALQQLEIDAGSPWSLSWQGYVYLRTGQRQRAMESLDRTLAMEPTSVVGKWALAIRSSIQGNRQEGLEALRQWEHTGIVDGEQLYYLAIGYGLLGDRAACIRALNRAVDAGFFNYPFMVTDSFLDSIRSETECQRVLAKAKTKHEAFKKRFFDMP
jgi:tetratricopeptide (TPR) repeat protein